MTAEVNKSAPVSLDKLIEKQYRLDGTRLSEVEVLTIAYKIAELINGLHRQGNTHINLDSKYIQVSLDPVDITPTAEFYKGLSKLSAAQPHSQKGDGLQFGNLMQKMGIDRFRDFRRKDNLSAIPGFDEAISRLDDLIQKARAVESKDEARKLLMAEQRKHQEASTSLFRAERSMLESKLGINTDTTDNNLTKRDEAIAKLQSAPNKAIKMQFEVWQTFLNPEFRTNLYELFIKSSDPQTQDKMLSFLERYSAASNLKSELPLLSLDQIEMLANGATTLKTQINLYQEAQSINRELPTVKNNPSRDDYTRLSQQINELQKKVKGAQATGIQNITELNTMLASASADLRIIEEMLFKREFKDQVLSEVGNTARKIQSKPLERTPEAIVEPEIEPPTLQPSEKDLQIDLREHVRQLQAEVSRLDQDLNQLKGKKSAEAQKLTENRDTAATELKALQQQLTYFSSPLSEGYHLINYEDFKKLTPVQKLEVVKGMHDIVHDAHQCGLMLNDLALDRFGIKLSHDGRIAVEYQGHAESIAHHQGHEATLLARADIFFLGETFKQLKLSAKLTDPMTTTDSEKRVTDQQITEKFKSLMPNQAALTAQQIENERLMSELKWQIHRYESQVGENPLLAYFNQLVVEDPNFALALFQKATEANQKDPMSKMLEEIAQIQNQESSLEQSTQTIQATISSLTQQREVYTTQLEGLEIQLQNYLQAQQQLKNIISASPEKLEKGELTFKDPLRGGSDVLIGASQDQLQKLSRSTSSNIMSHGNYIGKDYARDRLEKLNQYLKDNPTYKRYIAAAAALKKLEQQEARLREMQHSTTVQAKDDAKSLLKTWRQATIKSASDSKLSNNVKKQAIKGSTKQKPDTPKKPKRSQ